LDKPLQVLVVDDSALMRHLISNMLSKDADIEVVATAMDGQFALKKLKKFDVDVITLDLEMPVMGGLDFLKEKKRLGIDIPVIVFSSKAKSGARITLEALSLSASDFICKPTGSNLDIREMEERLINLVKVFGERYRQQKRFSTHVENVTSTTTANTTNTLNNKLFTEKAKDIKIMPNKRIITCENVEIVAIGISTGGPNALRQVLPALGSDFPVPVLIVQHMPPGFTEELANSLARITPLEVKEAKDGDIIRKGRIFIAPGGAHIVIEKRPLANIIRINHSEAVNGHRPSVDVMFASVAAVYHNNCLAALMTGMGKDGVKEIGTIYNHGGVTVAQEESSCIVPGMPGVAIKSGIIDFIVPLDKFAENIIMLTKKYTKVSA